jgi:2-dehydro-3-deoxy-L-rhamnonate dehydrogenase (NAD+)
VTTLDLNGADVDADVTDQDALLRIAQEVGPVDVPVNSAGLVGPNNPLLETSSEEWRRVLEMNVLGTVNTMRAFVPGMRDRGWGRVANFASMAGKGKELASTGVLVDVIAPAVITSMKEVAELVASSAPTG